MMEFVNLIARDGDTFFAFLLASGVLTCFAMSLLLALARLVKAFRRPIVVNCSCNCDCGRDDEG